MLELNTIFRDRGYRKDMGVKGAVAVLFNRRFIKSKKATTSNWANQRLSEAQLIYAANDAYAAVRVFHALGVVMTSRDCHSGLDPESMVARHLTCDAPDPART